MTSRFLLLASITILSIGSLPAVPEKDNAPLSLHELLKSFAAHPKEDRKNTPLAPEWIGTVKSVYALDVKNPDPPQHLRFTHGMIFPTRPLVEEKESPASLHIARLRSKSYIFTEGPRYHKSLPGVKAVSKCANQEELEKLLGPNSGWSSGWGDGERFHWSAGWVCFTPTNPDQLRYLMVSAALSAPGKNPDHLGPTRIDSMEVREGLFRPADPNSADEQANFPSGDVLLARDEDAKKAKRNKYPRPLRDLLEVDEHPDDSDLEIYGAYLQNFRTKPDPVLLKQIIAHTHENTVHFGSFLEGIFTDRISKHVKALKAWDPARKREALGYLIDALPESIDDDALFAGIKITLQSLGGGSLDLRDPASDTSIDLKVKANGGYSYKLGVDHNSALIRMAQDELRKLLRERFK